MPEKRFEHAPPPKDQTPENEEGFDGLDNNKDQNAKHQGMYRRKFLKTTGAAFIGGLMTPKLLSAAEQKEAAEQQLPAHAREIFYPTRALFGRTLNHEYSLYTGISGRVPDRVTINFTSSLRISGGLK